MSSNLIKIPEKTKILTAEMLSPCRHLLLPASLKAPSDEILSLLATWPDLQIEVYGTGDSLCTKDGFLLAENASRLLFAPRGRSELVLPEGIRRIAPGALAGLAVEKLILPSTLEILEGPEPEEEEISSSDSFAPEMEETDEVPSLPTPFGAFEACDRLTSIILPPSLRLIGPNAFADCTSLTEVLFSEGLIGIRENAFCGCDALTVLSLPESLSFAESNAFCVCRSLEQVSFAGSSVSLSFGTFSGCHALHTVRLADYVLPAEDLEYLLGLSLSADEEEDLFGDNDPDEFDFWMD